MHCDDDLNGVTGCAELLYIATTVVIAALVAIGTLLWWGVRQLYCLLGPEECARVAAAVLFTAQCADHTSFCVPPGLERQMHGHEWKSNDFYIWNTGSRCSLCRSPLFEGQSRTEIAYLSGMFETEL